ncbi:MAG: hypothetical protein GF393_00655 [Armatimonadia bacterium]|nr:hypothetical protein [Armatimonadia bacterium]
MRALMVCVASIALALGAGAVAAQQGESSRTKLEACPPPEGACAEDVVSHVLAESVDSWERVDPALSGDMTLTPALLEKLDQRARAALGVYEASCGASALYRTTDGSSSADVLMIAFDDTLNALGFFASQRTDTAERVLLTSASYRDRGVLHVYSCSFYFRVEARGAEDEALPPDQRLAARLEVRLPQREAVPRIIRVMPRGWVNALTVGYAPTDLLGESVSPMAASVTQMVGGAQMRLRIMEAPDEETGAWWYTMLLQQSLDRGRAWEVNELGDEAFHAGNGRPSVVMLQDRYLAHLSTDGVREDAVAMMRLVGTAIRITRPLPDDTDGFCPALTGSDAL